MCDAESASTACVIRVVQCFRRRDSSRSMQIIPLQSGGVGGGGGDPAGKKK